MVVVVGGDWSPKIICCIMVAIHPRERTAIIRIQQKIMKCKNAARHINRDAINHNSPIQPPHKNPTNIRSACASANVV